ncbi:circadian clock-controlled protein daywake-like [Hetaerina americana]|uniref:circadian clock-controlled protein daywake-like n=1 Tax=Hetaerina americana TaxID=62018 RepID=UPI003A7F2A12
MSYALGLILVLASSASALPRIEKGIYKLPEYMKVCQRSDASLDKCLKETLQDLIPKFSAGVPEFRMPALDPMHLSDLRMDYDDGSILGSILVKNMRVEGISNLTVVDVRTSFEETDKLGMEVDVFFPIIFMEGVTKMVGKLWELNLSTQAKFNVTMGGISATWKIRGEMEERDGREFLKVVEFDMKPLVAAMAINVNPLFPKSESMSQFAEGVINSMWPEIYEALLPMARSNWDKIMTQLANNVFQKIPLHVLLPL